MAVLLLLMLFMQVVVMLTTTAAVIPLSSLNVSSGHIVFGETASDSAGESIDGVGDFNQDGFEDIIIGAPDAGASSEGAAYLYFGSAVLTANQSLSALDGSNGIKFPGLSAGDQLGSAVCGGGDVNGDGIPDIAMSAPSVQIGPDLNVGCVYVKFGTALPLSSPFDLSSLDGSNGLAICGVAAETFFGGGDLSMGDVNGDAIDDLVIGSDQADPGGLLDAGEYDVIYGRDDGGFPALLLISALDGSNGFRFTGSLAGEDLGSSLCAKSDVNGDGIKDIISGAPGAVPGGLSNAGELYVQYGNASIAATLSKASLDGSTGYIIQGEQINGRLGDGGAACGFDLSADGLQDVIMGASFATLPGPISFAGASYFLYGNNSMTQPAVRSLSVATAAGAVTEIYGVAAIDRAGSGLSSNARGQLLVGALGTDNVAPEAGSAYLMKDPIDLSSSPILLSDIAGGSVNGTRYDGESANSNAGEAVSFADLNGDSVQDAVIAAPGISTIYIVYLFTSGSSPTPTPTLTATVSPSPSVTATLTALPTATATPVPEVFRVTPEEGRADTRFFFLFSGWPPASLYNVQFSSAGVDFLISSDDSSNPELQGLLPIGRIPVRGVVDGVVQTDTIFVEVKAVNDINAVNNQLQAVNDSFYSSLTTVDLQDILQTLVSISTQIVEADAEELVDDLLQLLEDVTNQLIEDEDLDRNAVSKIVFILSTLSTLETDYDFILQLLLQTTSETRRQQIGLEEDSAELVLDTLDPAVSTAAAAVVSEILTNVKIAVLQTLNASCDVTLQISSDSIEVELVRESETATTVTTSTALFSVTDEIIQTSIDSSSCSSRSTSQINASFDGLVASAVHSLSYHNSSNGFEEIVFENLEEPILINIQNLLVSLPSTESFSTTVADSDCSNGKDIIKKQRTVQRNCVFFDLRSRNWTTDGCSVVADDSKTTVCQCNHLTDFAVTIGANVEDGGSGGGCGGNNGSSINTLVEILSIAFAVSAIVLVVTFMLLSRFIKPLRFFLIGEEGKRVDILRENKKKLFGNDKTNNSV